MCQIMVINLKVKKRTREKYMRKILPISLLSGFMLINVFAAGALEYSGMVINDIGRPAAFATVTIENLGNTGSTMSVVTDTTGTFIFTLTPAGVTEDKPIPFRLYGTALIWDSSPIRSPFYG